AVAAPSKRGRQAQGHGRLAGARRDPRHDEAGYGDGLEHLLPLWSARVGGGPTAGLRPGPARRTLHGGDGRVKEGGGFRGGSRCRWSPGRRVWLTPRPMMGVGQVRARGRVAAAMLAGSALLGGCGGGSASSTETPGGASAT